MRKVIGLVVAVLMIDTAWRLAASWYPPTLPADADDVATLQGFVMTMPLAGQAIVAIGWLLAGLIGAYAALRVAQWRPAGWIVLAFIVITAIWNMTQLTQPLWLQILSVAAPLAGAWLAERHYHRARPGDPLIN
jgi:hypothetical protein